MTGVLLKSKGDNSWRDDFEFFKPLKELFWYQLSTIKYKKDLRLIMYQMRIDFEWF